MGSEVQSIKKLGTLEPSLSQKVVKGGFWVFSLRIVQQLFNLARLVIIAHIL